MNSLAESDSYCALLSVTTGRDATVMDGPVGLTLESHMPKGSRRRPFAFVLRVVLAATPFLAHPVFARQIQTADANAPKASIAGKLTALTGDGVTTVLPGVALKLTGPTPGAAPQPVVSDAGGHYEFDHLVPGTYTLEATEDGFEPWSGTIKVGTDQTVVEDIVLRIIAVNARVEVHGEAAAEASTESVTPNATVSNQQLDTLPLPTQKFTEALSLVPGVIRTAQGGLSFNGQEESQGMLLVDSAENVDPISGNFAIPVPVDAIQSMTVYSLPQSSGYGGFSGGLTAIETKPPSGEWDYKLLDFIPSFRGKNGHLVGLANWTPRFQFGGPLLANKVNFSQELTYEFRKTPVRGLAWPVNETETRSTTSFTQLQVIWSSRHLLNINVNVFPEDIEYGNINALVPQTASTSYHRNGVSVGISDTYEFASGALLNGVVRYTRFDGDAFGQGALDMEISPSGWGGNFFNTAYRTANQLEALPTYQFAQRSWHGKHQVRFGADVFYRNYEGSDISHPIQILAADGSLAEQIDFQGAGLLKASDSEASEFIEDRWSLTDRLTLNFGARLSTQSLGRDAAFAPRIGFAYAPGSGRTVFRASAAKIYSHVPLLAADFTDNQERVLSFFDPSGTLIGQPEVLENAYLLSGSPGVPPGTRVDPGTSPCTFSWEGEIEHEVNRNLNLKVSYLESYTNDLFVMDEVLNPSGGNGLLALRNTGVSRYHQAQATAHYRPGDRVDLTVSYTWSQATGDLNTLSDTLVPFAAPVIRPDASGLLPSDVPQRLLGTGLFRLPWKFILSPVVDVHSGLPFSDVDVLQNYVGVPDSSRFPRYFAMDARLYREFALHIPFMERSKNRKIRIGVYSTDLTDQHNPHDVYNNVTSPIFGQFAGFQKRVNGIVLDLVQ